MSSRWTITLRIGIWCAVSSHPQAEADKESLPAQRRAGEEFAQALAGQVVATYEVPGHTRDYWSWMEAEKEMPAYRQVREDLQAGKLDVIHCVDADRLGRDPALIQQFYSLAERCNCEIYDASMPHPVGQQSIGHRYGVAVKSVGAGEDQRRRATRHRMGMRGRTRRGLHPNHWPIGYSPVRDESGKVVGAEFNNLTGAVRFMTRMFLEGHSYLSIREALDRSAWTLPDGRVWYDVMVWRVLQSDVYAGYVNWGSVRNEEPSSKFPALWDGATYAAVLRERENRKRKYHHPRAGPLSGIVVCHRCGGSMGRAKMRHKDAYYVRCTRHARKTARPRGEACHPNCTPEADVMQALGEWLAQFTDPAAIEEALAKDTGRDEMEAEIERLQGQLGELEAKRRRLAYALADGTMDPVIYYEVDGELLQQQDGAQVRLAELYALLAARPDPRVRQRYILELLEQGLDLQKVPVEILGPALYQAGVRIYCEDRKVLFCAFST